jgi:hypothetical protein
MRITYSGFNARGVRCRDSPAELITHVEADIVVTDGDREIYSEPYYTVADLARALVAWLADTDRGDFAFEPEGIEEPGFLRISRSGGAWSIGCDLVAGTWSAPVPWQAVVTVAERFTADVSRDMRSLGLDPTLVGLR